MNLKDKIVVLTGAGSGIGRALAQQLAVEGAILILNDNKSETLAETIETVNGKVTPHVFDVSKREAWESFATEVIQQYGHVDVVINNAGVALGEISVKEVTIEQMEWLMGINYWGVVYGTKSFLPHLLQRPEASVVNISSVFGLAGIANQATYCSSKFAVRGFTESLRMEMLQHKTNVCVTTVHPGGIKTNIARDARNNDPQSHKEMAKNFDKVARTSPEEAARIIINGIKKKKHRILIGKDAFAMDRVVRWFPVRYTRIFFNQLQKMRRK